MRRGSAHVVRRKTLCVAVAAAATAWSSAALAESTATGNEVPHAKKSADRPPSDRGRGEPAEHVRFGPIVGIGFPRPFAVEGLVKVEKLVGVGFEYSFLPRMNVMNVDAGFDAFALDLRIFPFRGAFFIGARAGRQWLDAKTRLTAAPLGSFTESMEAATWFLNPRAGLLYTFGSGITIGIDAGVQFPIAPTYRRSGPGTDAGLSAGTDIDQTLVIVTNALGNGITPTIDLLRFGFLF